ncbi:MAG: sensor histidine kinase [Labilithrix sp.]|nr:sensor histidine kinase [Labilithrix sp.]MBX3224192.1 sensor histidine kinase [Labilithrix sp.]
MILSFLGATALSQWQSFATDRAAREIAYNTAPSIEHLTAVRSEIRNLQFLMRDELDRVERGQRADPRAVAHSMHVIEQEMDVYLMLPVWPEEQALWGNVLRTQKALDDTVTRFQQETARGDVVQASSTLSMDFATAATNLSAAIMDVIEVNATHAHDLALEIQRIRSKATYAAFGLDALATVIAVAGAVMLRGVIRDHAALVERHRALEGERASELEQFAGRVAHDILSPLGAVSFALQLASQPEQDDEKRARVVERGTSALNRVKRLVNGLLDFARAGATPDPDARADLRATLIDVASELQPLAEERAIDLAIKDDGVCFAKCNAGVLTSLIANLARNAIKYIGDGPVRRIEIRTYHNAQCIHVEVEDTGPGLAPDVEPHIFQPYARSHSATEPGIGLGLATVKRLAEAHGGRVGVRSVPGCGCIFWFELPTGEVASFAEPVPAPA